MVIVSRDVGRITNDAPSSLGYYRRRFRDTRGAWMDRGPRDMSEIARRFRLNIEVDVDAREIEASCICRVDGCDWEQKVRYAVSQMSQVNASVFRSLCSHLLGVHSIVLRS